MKEIKSGKELHREVGSLSWVPFLQHFERQYLDRILDSSRIVEYESGETIIREGERGLNLYVLIIGSIQVVKEDETIAMIGQAGSVFGELALVDHGIRSASVYAVGLTTWCLVIDASFLDKLSRHEQTACYAVLYRFLATIVADRLRTTNEELTRTKLELEKLKAEQAKR